MTTLEDLEKEAESLNEQIAAALDRLKSQLLEAHEKGGGPPSDPNQKPGQVIDFDQIRRRKK
jgi:hypothetical protein